MKGLLSKISIGQNLEGKCDTWINDMSKTADYYNKWSSIFENLNSELVILNLIQRNDSATVYRRQ